MHNIRRVGTFAALGCAAAIAAMAQTPDPAQTRSANSMDKVTITGCVQNADAKPTGTSGAAGAASMSTKFVLVNAISGGSSSKSTATGTSGSANPSSSATASSYRLDADDSKLTPHVGHKVEVTGTVDSASSSSSGAATEPPAASSSSTMNAPKLKVDSIKMIASTCS